MALLLCIDSSTTHASVAVAKDAVLLGIKTSASQKEHASFLQPGRFRRDFLYLDALGQANRDYPAARPVVNDCPGNRRVQLFPAFRPITGSSFNFQ